MNYYKTFYCFDIYFNLDKVDSHNEYSYLARYQSSIIIAVLILVLGEKIDEFINNSNNNYRQFSIDLKFRLYTNKYVAEQTYSNFWIPWGKGTYFVSAFFTKDYRITK